MPEPAFKPVGPAVIVMGDPTVALGAGMRSLGDLEDVSLAAGIRTAFTSSSRLNGTPVASGLYTHAPNPEIQAQLTDADLDLLGTIIQNSDFTTAVAPITTGTLGLGDEFTQVPDPPTVGLIPVSQLSDGIDAPNALWFPASTIGGLDGFQFGRIPEGEILQPYNVTFNAARRLTDQADDPIPAGYRIAFFGPPNNLGLTWSVPSDL